MTAFIDWLTAMSPEAQRVLALSSGGAALTLWIGFQLLRRVPESGRDVEAPLPPSRSISDRPVARQVAATRRARETWASTDVNALSPAERALLQGAGNGGVR